MAQRWGTPVFKTGSLERQPFHLTCQSRLHRNSLIHKIKWNGFPIHRGLWPAQWKALAVEVFSCERKEVPLPFPHCSTLSCIFTCFFQLSFHLIYNPLMLSQTQWYVTFWERNSCRFLPSSGPLPAEGIGIHTMFDQTLKWFTFKVDCLNYFPPAVWVYYAAPAAVRRLSFHMRPLQYSVNEYWHAACFKRCLVRIGERRIQCFVFGVGSRNNNDTES